VPKDLADAVQTTRCALAGLTKGIDKNGPLIIFVDAVDQVRLNIILKKLFLILISIDNNFG